MNCTQRTMDLSLTLDTNFSKTEQYLWIGIISRYLGKLEAHQTVDLQLELVPLTCGLKVYHRHYFQCYFICSHRILLCLASWWS